MFGKNIMGNKSMLYLFTTLKSRSPLHRNPLQVYKTFISVKNQNEDELKKKYFNFWQYRKPWYSFSVEQIQNYLQKQKKYQIMQFTTKEISERYKKYTPQCKSVLTNFYTFWIQLVIRSFQANIQQKHVQTILDLAKRINEVCFLIPRNKKFILNYFKFLKNCEQKYHSFGLAYNGHLFRIMLDDFRKMQDITPVEAIKILSTFKVFPVSLWYYQEADSVIKFFLEKVQIENNFNFIKLKHIWLKNGYYNSNVISYAEKLLDESNQQAELRTALQVLLITDSINEKNFKEEKMKKNLIKYISMVQKDNFFPKFIFSFARNLIWLPEFWLSFFNHIKADDNFHKYKKVDLYSCFKTFQYMKDEIDPQILQQCKKTEQFLEKKYFFSTKKFKAEKQIKGQQNRGGLSCQFQLANNLRLVTYKSIQTEVFLDLFYVDILVDQKLVVEVNGGLHYLTNYETGERKFNNKTKFREIMLKKMGYSVFHVDVEQFSDGSFQIISKIVNQLQKIEDEKI